MCWMCGEMKERFEEAKPVATGSNRRSLPGKEITATSFLGTPKVFFGGFRTIEERKIGFTMGGASRGNRSRKGNTL